MMGLALALFVALFAFSAQILGVTDTGGQLHLGLFASFVFGIVCGYRVRS